LKIQRFIRKFQKEFNLSLDRQLLIEALTHRSFSAENPNFPSYERLEFLGDSVLQLIVSCYTYSQYTYDEGQMTEVRAIIVSQEAFATAAKRFDLGSLAFIGRGLEKENFANSNKLLADIFESFVGCVFILNGYDKTHDFIIRIYKKRMDWRSSVFSRRFDVKGRLATMSRRLGLGEVAYEYSSSGENHNTIWTASAIVGGKVKGQGQSTNQKDASKKAASVALETLGV
jgi:ribonuclease-3